MIFIVVVNSHHDDAYIMLCRIYSGAEGFVYALKVWNEHGVDQDWREGENLVCTTVIFR